MTPAPLRIFNACMAAFAVSAAAALLIVPLQERSYASSNSWAGGWTQPPAATTPPQAPTSSDSDGDGMPNSWENTWSHHSNNFRDAGYDFDFDGLTAKQEYDLSVSTNGQFGKPLGTYAVSTIAPPPGFATISSLELIESASNGVSTIRVFGRLSTEPISRTHLFTYNPSRQQWTRVLPPASASGTPALTATDVNSRGQVVGYYGVGAGASYQALGFKWTPSETDPTTGTSEVFCLDPESTTPTPAIPVRISDTGYRVYSLYPTGPTFAADDGQHPLSLLDNSWTDARLVDVNDYGEFVGEACNFLTGKYVTFLAMPGGSVFVSALGISAFEGTGIHPLPDVDFDGIQWQELATAGEYHGTAVDRATQVEVDFYRSDRLGEVWWFWQEGGVYDDVTWGIDHSDVFYGTHSTSILNDRGEFAGSFGSVLRGSGYYWEEIESELVFEDEWADEGNAQGVFMFDGSYHLTASHTKVFGISNDPQVLLGSNLAAEYLWSDSVGAPLSKVLPSGSNSPAKTKICDNGILILQKNSTTLQIATRSDDADGDGLPDDWEAFYGLDPAAASDAWADADGDGISNHAEFRYRTSPSLVTLPGGQTLDIRPGIDSDGDGLPNVWEWKHGLNANDASNAEADSDGDGVTNFQEFRLGTDPNNPDTDGDGVSDGIETQNGSSPLQADTDGDSLPDGKDAAPSDGVIDWAPTITPRFAVIDLPTASPDTLRFDDLSDQGTVLFTRMNGSSPVSRLVIDKNRTVHEIPYDEPGLGSLVGDFGGSVPALIGDEVLGKHVLPSGAFDFTWDPVADSYTPFSVDRYPDDIKDIRPGHRVERHNAMPDDVLLTPQGILASSAGMIDARIEANGNIVAENGYWRFTPSTPPANGSYGGKSNLVETSVIRSATLSQTIPANLPQNQTWNLVASATGLLVSKNGATFVKSGLVCNASLLPVGVTSQGWVASAHAIWCNGRWTPLVDLVSGPKPTQATLLGILDTGLAVAKLQFTGNVQKIVLLLPVEIEQSNYSDAEGVRFCRWLDSFNGNLLKADCADSDRDRFRIRIPSVLPNLTKIHIKTFGLLTAVIDGGWELKNTDGDYDVTMKEEDGAMVSTWMLLVSDGDDDKYYNGKGTDNGTDDQTILANFNSDIVVTLPECQNAKVTFYAQKPLAAC